MSLDTREEVDDNEIVHTVSALSNSDSIDVNDYVDASTANNDLGKLDQKLENEQEEEEDEHKQEIKSINFENTTNEVKNIEQNKDKKEDSHEYVPDENVPDEDVLDENVTDDNVPEKSVEQIGELKIAKKLSEKSDPINELTPDAESIENTKPDAKDITAIEETKEIETPETKSQVSERNIKEVEIKEADISEETGNSIKLDKQLTIDSNIDIHDMESIDSEQESVIHHPKETTSKLSIEHLNSKKWFNTKTSSNMDLNSEDFSETVKNILLPSNLNLAYNRYEDNEIALKKKTSIDRKDVQNSRDNLKKTFAEIKTGVTITQNEDLLGNIDWEFWSEVFNNYSNIVKNKQNELKKNITIGIPNEIRGMVWQIISDSNSMKLKEYFINMKDNKSDFEKLIKRDLSRTSFIKNSNMKEKIDDLFNIIKTYSLYDHEVGYTQGMAFITVPILMNMESDEAFCLLVKLMFQYGFREFYLPEMPGLHLRIYQFDRLIEDRLPDLYLHLKNQKISSSMYAIQWFLTLFAYKFPLNMVLRIFDVVIAEGLESILKFSLNLMIKNKDHLLTLKFDELLDFIKDRLFYYYSDVPELPNENNKNGNSKTYQIDKFIQDSMEIEILPITLNKYRVEFDEIDRIEKDRENQIIQLQTQNGHLVKEIRKIESLYATLNRDHVEIANEMINGKLRIGTLEDENNLLNEQINELKERLKNLKNDSSLSDSIDFTSSNSTFSNGLDKEIQNAMDINLQVMDQNRILEEKLSELEAENQQLKSETKPHLGSMFGGLKKPGKFW